MSEIFKIGAMIAIIFGIVILGVLSMVAGTDYLDCRGFQTGTGIETKWEWGCYAKVDGQWVPKQYVFGKANEIRLKDKR
jgi:hypothetical protein